MTHKHPVPAVLLMLTKEQARALYAAVTIGTSMSSLSSVGFTESELEKPLRELLRQLGGAQ